MNQEIHSPSEEFVAGAHIDRPTYEEKYARSIKDPDGFWGEEAGRLDWIKSPTEIRDINFTYPDVSIRWFADGTLNVSANCVDRHLASRADQTAIIWEPDDPKDPAQHITYRELHERVGKFANVLKTLGVGKGDRVVLYLPMIPEAAYAMLACTRIGAIHSIVFAGFSPDALANRIDDSDAKVVITSDGAPRGGRVTNLKDNVNKALVNSNTDPAVLVVRRTGQQVAWIASRDHWLHEMETEVSADCPPEEMGAEDPLFILYTSGSTGKPKGVVHTTGGYLLYAAMTHQYVFDYHDGDVFWCTADVGWVTGHSYIVYGPLANGATTLMFEGVPTFPDASRFWEVCEKHKVNQFYTAPTAIRALMGQGEAFVDKCDLSSIKVLGTVGEPINPEAWVWYNRVVGKGTRPIVDTWWQTETGGHMLTPLPGAIPTKPGSATLPFFGIEPVVLEAESGKPVEGNPAEGVLCIADSWPGQMRTVWGDHQRFMDTYFQQYKGYYFSGDGCRRDEDGYYWITGRVDDVINVSGHRMGTAEVESALVAHEKVAEAAVVGYPHDIKGQGIYAYVTLMNGIEPTDDLRTELSNWVRTEIGPIAKPDLIQWAPGLPKTRSGKIMRRILRKIAENDPNSLGDTSTLADPGVVDDLVANRMNRRDIVGQGLLTPTAPVLVLIGPPGAGQGRQAKRLEARHGLTHLDLGDLATDETTEGGDLATLLTARLDGVETSDGIVLDGFPVTLQQAVTLDTVLAERGMRVDAAVLLTMHSGTRHKRVDGRHKCETCAERAHLAEAANPAAPSICDICGGAGLLWRPDDIPAAASFDETSPPLTLHYARDGALLRVDAMRHADEITLALGGIVRALRSRV